MPWRTATILLVDDEQPILDVLCEFLEEVADIKVLTAINGAKALKVLRANPAIDLMITDMLMPIMGGAELAQKAKQFRPDLRVLMISGSWSLIQVPDGDWPILAKPFTLKGLLEKIQEVMDQAPEGLPPVGAAEPEPRTRS